jgi:hypothetical protein
MIKALRSLALAFTLLVALPACDRITAAVEILTSAKVSPNLVFIAANTFDGLQVTATNYLRLPRCTGSNGPVCRDPEATEKIIPAIQSGRIIRDKLRKFLRDHPNQLGIQGDYDALKETISTVQAIFAQYNVQGVTQQ